MYGLAKASAIIDGKMKDTDPMAKQKRLEAAEHRYRESQKGVLLPDGVRSV
jgi:hypothetical protein